MPTAENAQKNWWHHLSASDVAQQLKNYLETGLSLEQVAHKQAHHGASKLTSKSEKVALMRFLLNFISHCYPFC
jgi:magnesium-transporting ATPase (P-type)